MYNEHHDGVEQEADVTLCLVHRPAFCITEDDSNRACVYTLCNFPLHICLPPSAVPLVPAAAPAS